MGGVTAPLDTSQQANTQQIAAYRSMGPQRRLVAALEMSEAARQLTVAGFGARHPDWTAVEVERAVAAALLGPGLASLVLERATAIDKP